MEKTKMFLLLVMGAGLTLFPVSCTPNAKEFSIVGKWFMSDFEGLPALIEFSNTNITVYNLSDSDSAVLDTVYTIENNSIVMENVTLNFEIVDQDTITIQDSIGKRIVEPVKQLSGIYTLANYEGDFRSIEFTDRKQVKLGHYSDPIIADYEITGSNIKIENSWETGGFDMVLEIVGDYVLKGNTNTSGFMEYGIFVKEQK